MDELNSFGEGFADKVSSTVQERRKERESISKQSRVTICDLAMNQGKISSGGDEVTEDDLQFTHTSENGIEHNVLLMQVPDLEDGSVWDYVNKLDSGAVTMPLDFLGDWMSCLFNDPEEAKKLDEGDWGLVVGNLDTWTNDKGETQDQMSPVRGVIPVSEAKELANEAMDSDGFSDEEEEEDDNPFGSSDGSDDEKDTTEDTSDEEGGDSSDEGGETIFGGGDDDEEEEESEDDDDLGFNYDDVASVVEGLADNEPEVWEAHPSETPDDDWQNFLIVVCERVGDDTNYYDDDDACAKVEKWAVERIEEEREDEDDDDEKDSVFS